MGQCNSSRIRSERPLSEQSLARDLRPRLLSFHPYALVASLFGLFEVWHNFRNCSDYLKFDDITRIADEITGYLSLKALNFTSQRRKEHLRGVDCHSFTDSFVRDCASKSLSF